MSMKRIGLILIAVVLIVGGALSFWIYRSLHKPVVHSKSGTFIEITRGTAPGAVIRKLSQEGIIKNEWPVLIYLKLTGTGSGFRAGEYDFPSPVTPLQVIEIDFRDASLAHPATLTQTGWRLCASLA